MDVVTQLPNTISIHLIVLLIFMFSFKAQFNNGNIHGFKKAGHRPVLTHLAFNNDSKSVLNFLFVSQPDELKQIHFRHSFHFLDHQSKRFINSQLLKYEISKDRCPNQLLYRLFFPVDNKFKNINTCVMSQIHSSSSVCSGLLLLFPLGPPMLKIYNSLLLRHFG